MKEKLSGLEAAGGGVESGFRASGAGRAVAGAVRPSSECATSCSSFEWIRARFAAIEVEGKENDTADTARAATGGGMELRGYHRACLRGNDGGRRDAAEWRFDLHGELDVERRRRGWTAESGRKFRREHLSA